ncbi:hypothetical protein [Methylobacterium sp. D48H]
MGLAEDKARFREAVAKRRLEPRPPGFLDHAGHEAVARATVEGNPDLVARTRDRKDFFPLIRAAEQAAGRVNVSAFLLSSLIGQIVRGEL